MKFRWLVTLGALATLAGVSGYAQTGPTLWISVPFEFNVNNTALPAGQYSISNAGLEDIGLLAMRSSDRQHVVLFTGNAAVRNSGPHQSSLEFHRYGNNYFLADIWWAEDASGLELPKSKTEKQFVRMASVRGPEKVVLTASR